MKQFAVCDLYFAVEVKVSSLMIYSINEDLHLIEWLDQVNVYNLIDRYKFDTIKLPSGIVLS